MAITTVDGMVAALAAAPVIPFLKAMPTAKAAGTFQSLWTAPGLPGSGATPATGSGAVPTSATAGALSFTNPTGGLLTYLAHLAYVGGIAGSLILYDRLVHTSGLSGTTTGAQTVNSTAITRPNANGDNVEAFIEWYAATGASAATITVSYTNQAGTAGRSSGAFTIQATPVVGQMQQIPLQAGDTGVQSVQSVTLSVSTGTAGNFGITLLRRIGEIGSQASSMAIEDYLATGSPQVQDSACIAGMVFVSATTAMTLTGQLKLPQG